jgi:hypothetical protein
MPAPENVKKGKGHLLLTSFVIAVFLIGGPYVLSHFRLMGTLKTNVWVIQVITFFGIVIKAGISYQMTKDFRYDKFAYDLSVLVMGGVLSCFAIQATSPDDMFSGLSTISFLAFASSLPISVSMRNAFLLAGLFIGALAGVIFSAIGVGETEEGKVSEAWNLFATLIGLLLLA